MTAIKKIKENLFFAFVVAVYAVLLEIGRAHV